MHRLIVSLLMVIISCPLNQMYAQSDPIESLVYAMLQESPIEEDLQYLCDEIGGRVTGSKSNEKSTQWAYSRFKDAGLSVDAPSFDMPVYWDEIETRASINAINFRPNVVAKYQSPPGQYQGKLIFIPINANEEWFEKQDLSNTFWLAEMDLCLDINGLFAEYAAATKIENLAQKYGASGIIFMSSRPNKLLYRFITSKAVDNTLPQLVMSRIDAQRCIRHLENHPNSQIDFEIKAKTGEAFQSENVIAEIKGSEYPEEIIIIGAHIDSWAMGTGANDNGCNVVMMIDIARQMKALHIKPKRTIRFALWNGEEQGYFGSHQYTIDHINELDNHKMALSVDIGSGALTGFFTNGRAELVDIVDQVLKPVEIFGPFNQVNVPIVGTDNFDFMLQGVPNLVGNHKPQLYGPNYHASTDTYDKVDLKQLKINSAIVAALTLGFANLNQQEMSILEQQNREQVQQIFDHHDLEFTMRMFNVWEPWINEERGIK